MLIVATYDPAADCPRFKAFLKEITGGDTGLYDYLRRIMGYMLTGKTREQVIFIDPVMFGKTAVTANSIVVAVVGREPHMKRKIPGVIGSLRKYGALVGDEI